MAKDMFVFTFEPVHQKLKKLTRRTRGEKRENEWERRTQQTF